MGRRKRKVIRTVRRTLPRIFVCPNCGQTSVRVWYASDNVVKVACGYVECGFKYEHRYEERRPELVDIYNLAVDKAHHGEIT